MRPDEGESIMHGSKNELPLVEDYGENFRSWQSEWGGMIVEISLFPAGIDAAPLFKGLPDDMCQAVHWGYVIKGRMRVKSADGEEHIGAGDAYYLEPGHIPTFDEDTELVEFSSKEAYQATLDVVARNVATMES